MAIMRFRRRHEQNEPAMALYLELMKRCLANTIYGEQTDPSFDAQVREEGRDWPAPVAVHTMIGLKRLENLQFCMQDVLTRRVHGDVIETGVWRGGATIFMRAILKAYRSNRTVWVADSFAGLPPPNAEHYPQDADDWLHTRPELAVSLDEVRANFARYGLLDDQVRFLPGWFRDTLPHAPIKRLSILRLDGDMYESTMDALRALYPKLSVGGYCIIDDYGAMESCRQAIHDYRRDHRIRDAIHTVDWTGAYWQRGRKRLIPGFLP